ncbi:hypothetical protein IKD67_01325 [Candidatus Saccharibacteria bacterium]|nr:hypothetical protein [Candidatus Saccharibacteria bacterium]
MIKIFTGEDRVRAGREIERELGADYEVIEGIDLVESDLPSIFQGASLFEEKRRILIRDLSANKAVFEKISNYIETPHTVIILELKLDKRSAAYKDLKDKIEIREFKIAAHQNYGLVFDIYRMAKRDGQRAAEMLDKIKQDEDPIRFCGLLISQALKDYARNPVAKEKRVLKELSKLDLELKSTSYSPWLLVESFLLRVSSL